MKGKNNDFNIEFLENKQYTFELTSNCERALTLEVYDPNNHQVFMITNDDSIVVLS